MKVWIERVHPKDPKEDRLWQELLKKVNNRLAVNEIPVLDAGVKLSDFHSRKAESGKCAGVYRDCWPVEQIPLAATAPAVATGFWARKPQLTPGRFLRHLFIIQ